MAPLNDDNRQDLESLQDLLAAISRLLRWLTDSSGAVPPDLTTQFSTVLTEAQKRLRETIDRLREVKDTDDVIWQGLENAGFIGEPLRLKLGIWRWLATRAESDTRDPPKPGWPILKRLLKFVNSLLGSLISVFPGLDVAKEFKEGVEVVADHQHSKAPPASLLNLR